MIDPGEMSDATIRRAGPADEPALVDLAVEYLSWAIDRLRDEYGVEWPPLDIDEVRSGWEQFRASGIAIVAEVDGVAIGMGAVRLLDDGAAEIKRMYVRPQLRGQRLGSRILDRLLNEAGSLGADVVRLDTIRFMAEAQRLYRSRGFAERPPYEGTEIPVPLQQYWLFFERSLD